MKTTFYISILLLALTNCGVKTSDKNTFCACCDKTYTNVDDALKCLNTTVDGNGTTADERLILIAYANKDLETNQKLGWGIIKDQDIVKTAKRNYALVILDADQYKILNDSCTNDKHEDLKKYKGKTFFIIANRALCVFGHWTLDDKKDDIIYRLEIGNGP